MAELGLKHVRYGVKPDMFALMGESLIFTLKKSLKGDFTDECEMAWKEVYNSLSKDMIKAQQLRN